MLPLSYEAAGDSPAMMRHRRYTTGGDTSLHSLLADERETFRSLRECCGRYRWHRRFGRSARRSARRIRCCRGDRRPQSGTCNARCGHSQLRRNSRILRDRCFFTPKFSTLKKNVASRLGPATILVNAAGRNDPRATVTQENPFEEISLQAGPRALTSTSPAAFCCPVGIRTRDVRGRPRKHHQHRECRWPHPSLPRNRLFSSQGSSPEPNAVPAREWGRYGVRVNSITPGFFPPSKTGDSSLKKTALRLRGRSQFSTIHPCAALVKPASWAGRWFFWRVTRPAGSLPAPICASMAVSFPRRSDDRRCLKSEPK